MTEITPVSAAALGSMVAAVPTSVVVPVATIPATAEVLANVVATGQFSSNTPEPLPLPDMPVAEKTHIGSEKLPAPILKHFEFGHLPLHLAAVSQEFHRLAHVMHDTLPEGPELSAGLRKLLEAKDCFVRAAKP